MTDTTTPEVATFAASTAERDLADATAVVSQDVTDATDAVHDVQAGNVVAVLDDVPAVESDVAKTIVEVHAMVKDIHAVFTKVAPFVEETFPLVKGIVAEVEKGGLGGLLSLFSRM